MPRFLEKNLWTDTCQNASSYPALEGDLVVDYAIIGGGYTGLSAALTLGEAGKSVAILEAQAIGHGGSGKNVGLVNAGMWLKPSEVVDRLGPDYGQRLNSFLGAAPAEVFRLVEKHQIDCEARHNGTLHCAEDKAGQEALRDRLQQWNAYDAGLELLDVSETERLTGSKAFCASLFDPRAGSIQPLGYAHGLAKAASASGASIFCNSPVLSVSRLQDHWDIKTPMGRVKAEKIISATGAYGHGSQGVETPDMTSLYYFQMATEPLSAELQAEILPEKHGTWDTHPILTSYRMNSEGRMMIGSVGRLDQFTYGQHKAWAYRKLVKTYPQLKHVKFSHEWHGRIGITLAHVPRLASPHPDWLSVWAYNGRGIAPGTAFGKLLAQMHLSGNREAAPVPFMKMKPELFISAQSFGIEFGAVGFHAISARL